MNLVLSTIWLRTVLQPFLVVKRFLPAGWRHPHSLLGDLCYSSGRLQPEPVFTENPSLGVSRIPARLGRVKATGHLRGCIELGGVK